MLQSTEHVAGDAVLEPVSVAAIAVLLLNDHAWKASFHNALTGKLSDVAGLVFFPLLLVSAWELACAISRRPFAPSRRALVVAIAATAVVFSAVKVSSAANDAYRVGLGVLHWPFQALARAAHGDALPRLRRVDLARDPTDLLALPALGVAAWAGERRLRATRRHAGVAPAPSTYAR